MRIWTRLVAIILAVALVATTFVPIGFSFTDGNLLSISMRQVGADSDPWLGDWAYRIKLTSDNTKVDTADLTHFPITVFLNSDNGETTKVFEEVGGNYTRIAMADEDANQFYVEVEQWSYTGNATTSTGVLHFARSGSTYNLPHDADKDYYLYYDSAHADNTDFVGVTQSTPAKNAWDSNFKGVWHKNSATNTTTEPDSTSNAAHGTKKANDEPADAAGKIGRGKTYDGTDDLITLPNINLNSAHTLECWLIRDGNQYGLLIAQRGAGGNAFQFFDRPSSTDDKLHYWNGTSIVDSTTNVPKNSWQYVAVTHSGSNTVVFYLNGAADGSLTLALGASSTETIMLQNAATTLFAKGSQDEVRISNVARSAAWIKATYNSLNDSLLTYGSEETADPDITSTPDSFNFGTLVVNTTSTTGLDYFTITNTGGVAVDIVIQGTDLASNATTEEQTQHNSSANLRAGSNVRVGQRLTISSRYVSSLSFVLSKVGSPSGDVTFTIRKVSDDSVIGSKVWGDASGLTTSAEWVKVELDSPVYVNEEVRICIEFAGGDSTNRVVLGYQDSDVKANEYRSAYQASWVAFTSHDCAYKYEYQPVWLLSDTATPAANTYGLKAGLDGGDYTVIVKKTATYNTLKSNLAVDATQDWGMKIWMPTSVTGYDGQTMTGTVTLVASAAS